MREHTRSRPVIFSIFLCLLVLLMVACGGPNSTSKGNAPAAPPDKQVLRLPIGVPDFTSLDPAVTDASADFAVLDLLFPGLVKLNNDNSVSLSLATAYHVSADGLSWTFTLRPNLTFSDGTPLTADSVAYSINRALTPATGSRSASFLLSIKDSQSMLTSKITTLIGDSLIVQGPTTITIVLSAPAPYFLQELAQLTSRVVNKKLIDKYGTSWTDHLEEGAGAGAFKVSSYSHSKGMTLVPNPNFYGTKARLQKIEYLPSSDPATVYKEYLAGQLDYAPVPPSDLTSAKSRKDFQQAPLLAMTFVSMNFMAKPFDNLHIRQAFDLAVDKDVLNSTVLHGAGIPSNHLLPKGVPGYNQKLTGPDGVSSTTGDKAKAQQLLQQGLREAGYSGISALPPIVFTYPNNSIDTQHLAEALTQEWQSVLGITVQLKGMDFATFISTVFPQTLGHAGPLQMWLLGYGELADPFFWVNSFFTSTGSFAQGNYGQTSEQKAVQQELETAAVNGNAQQRTQQYSDIEQKLANDVAWIPLVQGVTQVLLNSKVQNFNANGPTKTWSDVYIAA